MKNHTYGWKLKENGYVEIPDSEYNSYQKDMRSFIDDLSKVVVNAKCGWDGLQYKVMKNNLNDINEYMVLCVEGHERWIPISGNSKSLNLRVLGENIW